MCLLIPMGLRMAGNTGLLKMPMLKPIYILGYAGLLPFIMSAGLLLYVGNPLGKRAGSQES